MLTRPMLNVLMGLALVLTLLGGIALGISPYGAQAAQVASGPIAHHALADVDAPPPGH